MPVNSVAEVLDLDIARERKLRAMGISTEQLTRPDGHNKVTRALMPKVTAEHITCEDCDGDAILTFRFLGGIKSGPGPTCEGHGFVTRWV